MLHHSASSTTRVDSPAKAGIRSHEQTPAAPVSPSSWLPRPAILGLGVATPPHRMSQDESLKMFTDIVCSDDRQTRLARALYKKSGVVNRHTCVPHQVAYLWCQPSTVAVQAERLEELLQLPATLPDVAGGEHAGPTTQERMAMYGMFASELAYEAARQALSAASVAPHEITHLVTVTCTGFGAPGVELELIERLGLPRSTQRINVGFMGCHGAINGLRAAHGVSAISPDAKVLMVAVELCSLHYRFQWDSEGIVGNALFADGAGALVLAPGYVSQSPEHSPLGDDGARDMDAVEEQPAVWRLAATGSFVIPDSQQSMSWHVGNHGFEMLLTNEVGERIERELATWLDAWLADFGLERRDIDYWGVHPGGPRILAAVEESLGLVAEQLATSRRILRDYGNMSSPTVLFILNEFMAMQSQNQTAAERPQYALLLAFGPGLVAEVALLEMG